MCPLCTSANSWRMSPSDVAVPVLWRFSSRDAASHRIWSDAQRVSMPAFTGTLHQPERLLQASEWVASWTTYGLLLGVSKGCVRDLSDQITVVASLTPRQIDRGDVGWPYMLRQKQGSTEAGPVGRKRYVFALFLNYIITLVCNNCQIYKKSNTLL